MPTIGYIGTRAVATVAAEDNRLQRGRPLGSPLREGVGIAGDHEGCADFGEAPTIAEETEFLPSQGHYSQIQKLGF